MSQHPLFLVWLAVQAASVFLILVAFMNGRKRWQLAAIITVLIWFVLGVFVLQGGAR